jgi:hypothetical protein
MVDPVPYAAPREAIVTLYYEFGFDVEIVGAFAFPFENSFGAYEITLVDGTYAHTFFEADGGFYENFYGVLANYLNDPSALSPAAFDVSWSRETGYTITSSDPFEVNFSAASDADAGARAAALLGFSGDLSGSNTYSSDVRPSYFIVPAIGARTKPSDEKEPPGVTSEGVTDSGGTCQRSRRSSEIHDDWEQAGEDMRDVSGGAFEAGTPVYRRQATAAVPWTYQHAWAHHKKGFDPFIAADDDLGETVHRMRAEGCSFKPARIAGVDVDVWSIPFRTRQIGRLS